MKFLNISHNPIKDISELHGLDRLKHFDIKDTLVTDFNPLSRFTELEYLGLEYNRLTHFYPIKNLERLNDIV